MEPDMELDMDNDEIVLRRDGRLGHIILNRPAAINALTHAMVTRIAAALDDWEHDDSVATILLTGAGERGLCAGGDIVAIHRDAVNRGTGTERFLADEDRLNARIADYPKPYVALMDGLVLGGGVGVSAHGALRVVTEPAQNLVQAIHFRRGGIEEYRQTQYVGMANPISNPAQSWDCAFFSPNGAYK